ncbi:SDR family NAD(P)-dependent oxidoreductase [Maledivibacter halophilus]|uniref:NAD(P)-dependent dehydrogenase, short-chain alcohol dehydrogenase family n=1 Tax=Maledivibacter halophilus TaxID=36842 RepID=A0A1T5M6D4_9FIRM|nr:SDR family oxidoreductase [Maledivibacter halophilus]SKC83791.1 NAD(P)-dependent dehydrogenase, short-chain alcohol dehydrogenase family [Maledivibacter halophilus]
MFEKKDILSLDGKVAVISGGAAGIGLGAAQLLSAYGAKVAILDVNPEGKEEAEKIRKAGRDAEFFKCDVTSSEEIQKTVNEIKEKFNSIDILFNNAGVTVRKTVVELEEKEWDFVIDVGLKGTFLLSKYVIPVMIENGGGSIINTGSGWGLKGGDQAAAYCAVKGGIVNLTRAMAIDHGPQNIRVNSVNPGDTDTAMLRDEGVQTGLVTDKTSQNKYLEECGIDRPLKRIGMPEDIANAVLYLASDLSSWVTGAALVVDGGGIA